MKRTLTPGSPHTMMAWLMLRRTLFLGLALAVLPWSTAWASLSQSRMDHMAGLETIFIGTITVEGNQKTADRIVLQEIRIKTGDRYDAGRVEESRRLVQNLELFQNVRFFFDRSRDPQVFDLVVSVRERWSFLPEPQINRSTSGTSELGVEIEDKNFLGRGQRVSIQYEQVHARDFDIDLGTQWKIRFEEPRLFGTYYLVRAEVRHAKDYDEWFEGKKRVLAYKISSQSYRLAVGKRVRPRHQVELQTRYTRYRYERLEGSKSPPDSSRSVSLTQLYAWKRDDSHPWFVLSGFRFEVRAEENLRFLGSSDQAFWGESSWTGYKKIGALHNLALHLRGGRYFDSSASKEFLASIGGDSLRGYPDGRFRGQTIGHLNSEWRFPLGHPFWKDNLLWGGVLFVDAGAVSQGEITGAVGAGAGLRLFSQKLIGGIFRLDAGYGFQDETLKFYAGLGHAF